MNRRHLLQGLSAAALLPLAAGVQAAPGDAALPLVSLVVNVQDFRYPDESAETVTRLCAILQAHGVRGDFYLTHPVLALYHERGHGAVVDALRAQGLCYHVRPPHPLFHPFDARLRGLGGEALALALRAAETQALDLATGALDPAREGGFLGVTTAMGRPPTCVGLPNPDPAIRAAALDLYRELGARAFVKYHGEKARPETPYEWTQGLLARPADIVIDRWAAAGEPRPDLWWNRAARGELSLDGRPEARLRARLSAWRGSRAPFVQVPIHENNVAHHGPDAWRETYWADEQKTVPRSPPYDLGARDPSRRRSRAEQERIFEAWEALVAWAAENSRVSTMEDLVALAPPAP